MSQLWHKIKTGRRGVLLVVCHFAISSLQRYLWDTGLVCANGEWTRTIAENPGSPCTCWCMSETVWPNAVHKRIEREEKKKSISYIFAVCCLSLFLVQKKKQIYYTFRHENSIIQWNCGAAKRIQFNLRSFKAYLFVDANLFINHVIVVQVHS